MSYDNDAPRHDPELSDAGIPERPLLSRRAKKRIGVVLMAIPVAFWLAANVVEHGWLMTAAIVVVLAIAIGLFIGGIELYSRNRDYDIDDDDEEDWENS